MCNWTPQPPQNGWGGVAKKVLKKKIDGQIKILYPAKISFKNKDNRSLFHKTAERIHWQEAYKKMKKLFNRKENDTGFKIWICIK